MPGTGTPERISQLCVPKIVGHLNEMGLDELKRPFNIVLDALQSPTTIPVALVVIYHSDDRPPYLLLFVRRLL